MKYEISVQILQQVQRSYTDVFVSSTHEIRNKRANIKKYKYITDVSVCAHGLQNNCIYVVTHTKMKSLQNISSRIEITYKKFVLKFEIYSYNIILQELKLCTRNL